MSDLSVLITGSSSGFGYLTAKTLIRNGYTVFATMRDITGTNANKAEDLRSFAQDKPGYLVLLEMDVTDSKSVQNAIHQALQEKGKIDVVVNNAGFGVAGFAEAVPIDQFHRQFDVNVYGIQRVNRAILPAMRQEGSGLLIHISSTMGRIVIPFAAPYTASKYAVEGLTESYRYELAGTGVDVVIVEPGGFPTTFFTKMEAAGDTSREESYGALNDVPKKMWSGMGQMLQSENAPNPQIVADAIMSLIETPTGERPFRTIVDPMMGGKAPSAINRISEDVQRQLLESLNMGAFLSVKKENG